MDIALHIATAIAILGTVVILHELAHGYAALALGDETAMHEGRLSLNPLRHIDRVGTLLLPGFFIVSQLLTVGRIIFVFGWAKPVPVDPTHFRAPRQMMALVALAGPAMNIALAFLAAHALRIPHLSVTASDVITDFVSFNLLLAVFNLIPIPPLDGGRVLVGILPLPLAKFWSRLEPFGIVAIILLVAVPAILRQQGIQVDPLSSIVTPVIGWIYTAILHLAGVRHVTF